MHRDYCLVMLASQQCISSSHAPSGCVKVALSSRSTLAFKTPPKNHRKNHNLHPKFFFQDDKRSRKIKRQKTALLREKKDDSARSRSCLILMGIFVQKEVFYVHMRAHSLLRVSIEISRMIRGREKPRHDLILLNNRRSMIQQKKHLQIIWQEQWKPLLQLWLLLDRKETAILWQRDVCFTCLTLVAWPQYSQLFLKFHKGEITR